jgi:hypothetical protein
MLDSRKMNLPQSILPSFQFMPCSFGISQDATTSTYNLPRPREIRLSMQPPMNQVPLVRTTR